MNTACAIGIAAGVVVAASASAAPTFILSVGDDLYVRTGANQQQFSLTDNITSMAVTPSGDVIGSSSSDDGNNLYEMYRIDNPTTAPTLSLLGDFLTHNTPSITYVGNTLYGIQNISASPNERLVTIDIGAGTETIVGQTGEFALNAAGSGYDVATDSFYAMNKANPGELYDLDYGVVAPNDPTASLIGTASIPFVNHAGEFFGGKLYGVVQVGTGIPDTIDVFLGELNTSNGDFTVLAQILDNFDQSTLKGGTSSIGLAVIPAPSGAAVLGLATLGLMRRRR